MSSGPHASPRSGWNHPVFLARGDRHDLAGDLVDLPPVFIDLLHSLLLEPLLDRTHDRVLPAEEVAVGDEVVAQLQVPPWDPKLDGISAHRDGFDERLDRVATQLGAVLVVRIGR